MTNRRNFIKNIALGASAMTVTALPMLGQANRQTNLLSTAFLIKGRVTSQSKAISNVGISDGYSIVQTSHDGTFTFQANTRSKFVFLILPSGYQIPVQANGSSFFYHTIDTDNLKDSYDFELEKLIESDYEHHFVVLADPQIQLKDEAEMLLNQTVPDVKQTIKSLGSNVFGIGCGDLIWDKHELFDSYNQAVQQIGIPFFQVFGNHDADLKQRSDEKSTFTFNELYGPTYYSFNRGQVHYIVLDDVFFIGKSKEYIGYLTEDQLAYVEQDLKYVEKGSTVIVSMHIPSFTRHFEREPHSTSLGAMVSNREYLYAILEPYNAHILSGHTHFNENVVLKPNLFEHCHGTVCGAWWSGPICTDGTPSGYGVYSVKGNELSWYYKSTGLPKDYQFRVYPNKNEHDDDRRWTANIWNWDSSWKAYYYQDGVKKGELTQIRAMDPFSIELHQGPKIPLRRKWVEPTLTDHLFVFTPSEQAKEIKVEVVDRFGTIYSQVFYK